MKSEVYSQGGSYYFSPPSQLHQFPTYLDPYQNQQYLINQQLQMQYQQQQLAYLSQQNQLLSQNIIMSNLRAQQRQQNLWQNHHYQSPEEVYPLHSPPFYGSAEKSLDISQKSFHSPMLQRACDLDDDYQCQDPYQVLVQKIQTPSPA
jgi:hypothetical protein